MIKLTIEFNSIGETQDFLNKHYEGALPTVKVEDTDADGQPNPPPAEEPKEEVKEPPKARRRGRPAKKEEDAKPTTGRRRAGRPAKEEAPATSAEEDANDEVEISDAEVSKAASEAAKELSVQQVLDELAAYKVAKVSELSQPQRREFVEALRNLLNEPEEKAFS